MYTADYIGRRLYRLRDAIDFKQARLAAIYQVGTISYGRWERSVEPPPLKSLIKICNITGIDMDSFLDGESWLDDLTPDSPGVDMIRKRLEACR